MTQLDQLTAQRRKQRRQTHVLENIQWGLDTSITVVLFAGLGGACQGLEDAGFPVNVANNHDDVALAAHAALHPHTKHVRGSIFDVDPLAATGGRTVRYLWASPDCFVPGTLVLTRGGLVPIEEIKLGQEVLTHRNRWRKVVRTDSHPAETIEVRGYGHYGLITTPEHAFYSKRITSRWDEKAEDGRRLGRRRDLVENPYWPKARQMRDKLWATPRAVPPGDIPICAGIEFSVDFFYLFGRWLGDGSLNKGDVEICTGRSDAPLFETIVTKAPLTNANGVTIPHRTVDRTTTIAFAWGSASLAAWLEKEAGTYCETKRLPIWCLSMQRSWRAALLQGYVDADGNLMDGGRRTRTSSVSKALSIGIRLLATSLGLATSLFKQEGVESEIEGRKFMARDSYHVAWTTDLQKETTFEDSKHKFSPVREVVPAGIQTVVSLQVEEDESFVADGIVVHNCTDHSVAKGGAPRSPRVRSLPWQVCRWAGLTRPEVIFVENVREIRGWGPLVAKRCKQTGRVIKRDGAVAAKGEHVALRDQMLVRDKKHLGRSYRRFVAHLKSLGYAFEDRDLNCADFGIPTSRKRLFAVARRDGLPIAWPAPTHGPGLLPYVPAADIIDWSIPLPSIFERKKELASATLNRVAVGLQRFVINNPRPFLIPLTHQGGVRVVDGGEPLPTLTTAHRGEFAVVAPVVTKFRHDSPGVSVESPLPTVTANGHSGGNHFGAVAATLAPARTTGRVSHATEVASLMRRFCKIEFDGDVVTTEIDGVIYAIVDIGMRMLEPHEAAAAHELTLPAQITVNGKTRPLTKTEAMRLIGNSVPKRMAYLLAKANTVSALDLCKLAAD